VTKLSCKNDNACLIFVKNFFAPACIKEGKCRDFRCNSEADTISLFYHTNQKKMQTDAINVMSNYR